ncbi:MAG: hypothetical protein C3F02_01755 [Parcubacteria group bacterium]|nr:MAG: hypothetical protein C3F02_01755 [Parcubacteria group bacterium]
MKKLVCQPKKIFAQLHRIEGQVRSIEKMYEQKRSVEEIIRVVLAARASLDSMTRLLVNDKINGCYDRKMVVKKEELSRLIDVLFDIT